MPRRLPRISVALVALAAIGCFVHTASADRAKLDPRARVALAQIEGGETAAAMKNRAAAVNGASELDVFIVGNVSRAELEAAGARIRTEIPGAGIFTAYIPATAVDAVSALSGVMRIQGSAPCEPELAISVPTTGANLLRGAGPAFTGLNGAGVIVGDVDSGVDYGHGDFKDAGGLTRFVNIWDQTTADAPPPGAYGYGSEWDAASINANVATEVDVSGHGTHVLGIAGGDGSQTGGPHPAHAFAGMAPMADLIMVKTTFQTSAVVDGVNYVFDRATALGKNAVCNLSLGSHFGPHDGTDAFEAGLSAMTGPGRLVVKSAGNERTNANHAEVFATVAGTNATMSVSGGAAAGTVVAIDGYYESTEILSVQITTPGGFVVGPVLLGTASAPYPGVATPANGLVYIENGMTLTATGDRQVYIELNNPGGATLTGTWTIRFFGIGLGAANGEVDMWRFFNNTSTANFVTGNQPTEEKVSQPGNAVELITTAAYASRVTWIDCNNFTLNFVGAPPAGALAGFSSPGPTRDGRQKPDIAAPGTPIASATSFDIVQVCAAGGSVNINDGMNHTVNSGTSMAAPHTTGALALIMQKYGAVTPAFAKAFLNARAVVDANTGAVWNKDWGNGKLHLGDMVDPDVTVLSPNGGESYIVGNAVNLTWNATDALGGVTAVDLYLSRNGNAGPWETIATGEANDGTYAWVATGPATNNALLRAVAKDAALNSDTDESDAKWEIDDAVPAVMQYFEGETSGDGAVTIRWQFEDDGEFRVIDVERSESRDGPYAVIDAERTSFAGGQIAVDRTAVAGHTYFYRLAATLADNSRAHFGPIMVSLDGPALAFGLGRVAPNPSLGPVGIDFSLAREAKVRVSVVNVAGREVAELADGVFGAGVHHVSWDRGAAGAPAGLYFVVYRTPERTFTQRVVVTM
jgi:subtilisin family serine protease